VQGLGLEMERESWVYKGERLFLGSGNEGHTPWSLSKGCGRRVCERSHWLRGMKEGPRCRLGPPHRSGKVRVRQGEKGRLCQ